MYKPPTEQNQRTKYLGIIITLDLNWHEYIDDITARTNQSLGFVKRNIKQDSESSKPECTRH